MRRELRDLYPLKSLVCGDFLGWFFFFSALHSLLIRSLIQPSAGWASVPAFVSCTTKLVCSKQTSINDLLVEQPVTLIRSSFLLLVQFIVGLVLCCKGKPLPERLEGPPAPFERVMQKVQLCFHIGTFIVQTFPLLPLLLFREVMNVLRVNAVNARGALQTKDNG